MEIKAPRFVTSFASADKYAEYAAGCSVPEICVAGRSNVGKSTFINMLTRHGKLAKTSSTPGRTRLINVFDIGNGLFRLVDLPGYGYAKAAKGQRGQWDALMDGYFTRSPLLCHALVLVDCRHEPSALDVDMTRYLYYYNKPFTVIATKADKLSRSELSRAIMVISATLGVGRDNIIAVDKDGNGRDKVLARLESVLTPATVID